MRLARRVSPILLLLVLGYCAVSIFTGYSATAAVFAKGIGFTNRDLNDGVEPVLVVGKAQGLDACISDKGGGDMYFFVYDCASHHPGLFRWSQTGPGVVRVDAKRQQLIGVAPGPFTLSASALGRRASFTGRVIPPIDLRLSTYDTVLDLGSEMVVGTNVESPSQTTVFPVTLGANLTATDAVALEPLPWAFPPAARIRARRPGAACVDLNSYQSIVSLRIVVRDSAGKAATDAEPRCAPPSAGDAPAPERAALPVAAVFDSAIGPAARMAFAFEVCAERWLGDTTTRRQLGVCEDSAARYAPDWQRQSRNGYDRDNYTIKFTRLLWDNEDERRDIWIDAATGMVRYQERHTRRPQRDGPEALLQGYELEALRAVAACDRRYREVRRRAPSGVSDLVRFAASSDSTGCDASHLHFRGGDGDAQVHESGTFVLTYAPRGSGPVVTVRPVRWGVTGVVSYRLEGDRVWRTYEDRLPGPRDQPVH